MITLFILGAIIGSGACITLDLIAQNKNLKQELDEYHHRASIDASAGVDHE